MVTYANNTVSNGDITVNLMETNISIDMTVIIVTTSAATLDCGIDIEVAIVIVAMHVIADPQIAHTIPRFVEPQRWLQPHVSESGSLSESSRTPVITFAMAATFVTETNTRTVLMAPQPLAPVSRASVLHMTVAHVKERPGAPSLTFRSAMVLATSRLQRPSTMSLSHQRSQTTTSLHTQHRSVQWYVSDCKPSPSSSSTSTLTQHDYLRPAHRQTCGPAQTPTR